MKKRIQRKIENLRQEPEDIRMRAVTYFTLVSGIVLVVLWLAVFLPLQLYVQRPNNEEEPITNEVANNEVIPTAAVTPRPQIGGIQDRVTTITPSPSPSTESLPVVSSPSDELPLSTVTPTSTPTP